MLIDNIFMELRSRLRSCNVYITTGINFQKKCNLKINIQSHGIVLYYYTNDCKPLKRAESNSSIESLSDCYSEDDSDLMTVIPVSDFCKIIPNSMSGLKIEGKNISFRILTEPKNGGNFYQELLAAESNKKVEVKSLNINVKANAALKIACGNCSNVISDSLIKFDRVLELPTSNLDMSEWFCHNHSHGESNTQNGGDIQPQRYDFLYRLTFFVVSPLVLSEKTNKFNLKREAYHCNRCLAWLGLKTKTQIKLYNSTVKMIKDGGNEMSVFAHKHPTLHSLDVNDFIYTIECMTKEFNLGLQYSVMCKIVLECCVASAKKQYLLIWIMDKELEVLQSLDYIQDEKIKLKSSLLTKILFKIEDSLNDNVETWISDPTIVSTEISKNMFISGIDHLNKMSLKVPESFRITNGYTVSYLNV